MFISKRKFIAFCLVLALMFTCVGGGIGMLFQNQTLFFGASAQAQEMVAGHGCCGQTGSQVDDTGNMAAAETGSGSMDHHIANATLTQSSVLLLVVIFFSIFLAIRKSFIIRIVQAENYVQSIYRRYGTFQHFRLHIIKLFSQGILHTQVW